MAEPHEYIPAWRHRGKTSIARVADIPIAAVAIITVAAAAIIVSPVGLVRPVGIRAGIVVVGAAAGGAQKALEPAQPAGDQPHAVARGAEGDVGGDQQRGGGGEDDARGQDRGSAQEQPRQPPVQAQHDHRVFALGQDAEEQGGDESGPREGEGQHRGDDVLRHGGR
ncbi:hypothetical protein GGS23DRAFT_351764 [Durotheca rogersii]|uniref:uncharacterized protein n=1 Tax=Durotheca rogersii TaxID=419775 RepID=UPI00221EA03C|nr:uncharacterized protein GGS23DRAFT_351764 [Durotheca rogersii]KAI5865713.1 hypothetical protein GGS23DRAFT_351764 [Durotheca rogersii]